MTLLTLPMKTNLIYSVINRQINTFRFQIDWLVMQHLSE